MNPARKVHCRLNDEGQSTTAADTNVPGVELATFATSPMNGFFLKARTNSHRLVKPVALRFQGFVEIELAKEASSVGSFG